MTTFTLWDRLIGIISRELFLERLFTISLEFAVLTVIVWIMIRLMRIKQPRFIALLWLVVMIKPIIGLCIGTQIPLFKIIKPVEAAIEDEFDWSLILQESSKPETGIEDLNSAKRITLNEFDTQMLKDTNIAQDHNVTSKSENISSISLSDSIKGLWLFGAFIFLILAIIGPDQTRSINGENTKT